MDTSLAPEAPEPEPEPEHEHEPGHGHESEPAAADTASAPASASASAPHDTPTRTLLASLCASYGVTSASGVAGAERLLGASLSTGAASYELLTREVIADLFVAHRQVEAAAFARTSMKLKFAPAMQGDEGRPWRILSVLRALGGGGGARMPPRGFGEPEEELEVLGDVDVSGEESSEVDEDYEDFYDEDGNLTEMGRRPRGEAANFEVPRRRGRERVEEEEPKFVQPVTTRSAEVLLVRDVMLIVQGESGRFVRFSGGENDDEGAGEKVDGDEITLSDAEIKREASEAVRILPLPPGVDGKPLAVSPASVHLVRCIAELGFLFNVINHRVQSVSAKPGLVSTNFCAAVEREMETFYRSLATFRSGSDTVDDHLPTLRTVYVWAETEKPRLRWLARLCDETASLVGGQMLAHLRSYHKSYVASEIHAMLSRIIARTAAPLDLMLVRWVTEGVLVDPHEEFYIMENPRVAEAAAKAAASAAASGAGNLEALDRLDRLVTGCPNAASSASHRIWWGLFKVRRNMIPGTQTGIVVENTLIAGKSIAFLRRCCGDARWVDQVHAPAISDHLAEKQARDHGGDGVGGRGFGMGAGLLDQDPRLAGTDHVAELVSLAVRSASVRLKDLFFDKFDLSHHFAAIKNYLLLAQGDFTQALMDSLAPLLDGDGRILRNNITGLLDSALRGSSSFNPVTDADIAERLDVQIVAQSGEDCVGWDVFSLTYRVEDAPLNTVFSSMVMDAYLQIFRFLWRLKRVDYALCAGFMELREMDGAWRKRRRLRASEGYEEDAEAVDEVAAESLVSDMITRANFLRMRMTHVLQNLQYYCTFEVLEGNWKVLSDDMSRAQDIDTLIRAHAAYLATIKDRTLLSERSKGVALALDAVLNTMLTFRAVQREMCQWAEKLDQNLELSSAEGDAQMDQARRFCTELESVEQGFDKLFATFLGDLSTHSREVASCMFLLFRLDFNGYFAQRVLGAERVSGTPIQSVAVVS